ncbi:MAG: hypothetical protein DI538_09955 [Azospira oryzae]|jgi:uncharacterized protein (DUF1684 family)|nr:MAG: hypothetical protein DI538_09955 [Azospira oryzae]
MNILIHSTTRHERILPNAFVELSLAFMKKPLFFILFVLPFAAIAQVDTTAVIKDTEAFQNELNNEYSDKSTSPLTSSDFRKFKQHDFFPIDTHYAIEVQLVLTPNTPFLPMEATGSVVNEYRSYAIVRFELNGKPCELTLYQSKSLMNTPEYHDYLFLPFMDETSGNESYGGGRYLEVRIPKEGDTVLLNFNKAYNPYCAYSHKYSCPRVPANNSLPIAVKAGVRFAGK